MNSNFGGKLKAETKFAKENQGKSIKVNHKGETNQGVLITVVNERKQILTKDLYEDQHTYEHKMEF